MATKYKECNAVSSDCYDELLAEVMKMKPKKRKNYKSWLSDSRGVRSKVKYIDGKLMNYSLITRKSTLAINTIHVNHKKHENNS